MTDNLDPLRQLRPDTGPTGDPDDPDLLSRHKAALMASIGDSEATPRTTPAIYPRLAYLDEVAALEYLTRVFGFTERREARMGTGAPDDGMLAWLEFRGGVVMICRADEPVHRVHRIYSPRESDHPTAMMQVSVRDIDAHYARAVREGADITMELEDAFYGSRRYEVTDLEGHRWHFSESLAEIRARAEESQGRGGLGAQPPPERAIGDLRRDRVAPVELAVGDVVPRVGQAGDEAPAGAVDR
jgi:uncharacterized glyoxalase superfamily protein PhnB